MLRLVPGYRYIIRVRVPPSRIRETRHTGNDGTGRDRGLEPRGKKCGKKAWTRSTVVSERGRPAISHPALRSPSASLASGFRCNHYVTHPPPPAYPCRSQYNTPPLSGRAADRSCARDGSITLARRLLSYSRAVSLFTASSFLI